MYGTYPLGSTSSADLTEPNQRGYVPYIPPGEAPHRQTPRNRIYRGMYRTYPPRKDLIVRPLGAESARVCTVHTPFSLTSQSNKRSRKSASFRSLDADKLPGLIRTEIAPLVSLSNEATTFPSTLNTLGGSC